MMLAQVTAEMVGKMFTRGGRGQKSNEGFDCVTIALKVLKEKGAPVNWDDEHYGKSMDEWVKEFESGNELAFDIAIDYIISKGVRRVPAHKATAGDILLLKLKRYPDKLHFFGIDGGNGNVIVATEDAGIRGASINMFTIEEVYKWDSGH